MTSNDHLLRCSCYDPEHIAILTYFEPKENGDFLYLSIHLCDYQNIFQRIWAGLKYIFGYKSKYGEYDELVLSDEAARSLIEYLTKFIDDKELSNGIGNTTGEWTEANVANG
jgi:hypothetical protein